MKAQPSWQAIFEPGFRMEWTSEDSGSDRAESKIIAALQYIGRDCPEARAALCVTREAMDAKWAEMWISHSGRVGHA